MLSAIFGAKIQKGIVSFRILTFAYIFTFLTIWIFAPKLLKIVILGAKIQMRHSLIFDFRAKNSQMCTFKNKCRFFTFFRFVCKSQKFTNHHFVQVCPRKSFLNQ